MSFKPKVALAQDFLLQLARLPVSVHSKVMKWAIRFQADPTSSGINYENINGAKDPNLKSVRLDNDWRGIVFKPTKGDVYVLLYVDHHDEAYRWAENKRLAINPVTGAMQLVVLEQVVQQESVPEAAIEPSAVQDEVKATPSAPLFAALSDHELMSLGVPEELIAPVRAVATEGGLDAIQARLPIEAYEGLFLVHAGD